jgi:hypothetical protein
MWLRRKSSMGRGMTCKKTSISFRRRFRSIPDRCAGDPRPDMSSPLRFPGSEGLFFDDAFAFLDGYELPRGNFGEILGFAIEPPER